MRASARVGNPPIVSIQYSCAFTLAYQWIVLLILKD